ncbi:MAG: hypothetical protein LBT53_01830 [Puniceicoccales bacterium]|nr:hypothetical protein [Puniceicoccales bacterium]
MFNLLFFRMNKKSTSKELKSAVSIAMTPTLRGMAAEWTENKKVSLSSVVSAALKILLHLPLSGKELLVEAELRGKMDAPASISEAQIERRLRLLEEELEKHRRPHCQGYCLPDVVAKWMSLRGPEAAQASPVPVAVPAGVSPIATPVAQAA